MKLSQKIILLGTIATLFSCQNKLDYGKLGAPDKNGRGKYDIENMVLSKNIQLDSLSTLEDKSLSKHNSNGYDGFYPEKIEGKNYSLREEVSFKTKYDGSNAIGVISVYSESNSNYEIKNFLKKEEVNEREYRIETYLLDKNLELFMWDTHRYTVREGNSKDTEYFSNTYLKRTEEEREIMEKLDKEYGRKSKKENPEILKEEQPKIDAYLKVIRGYKKIKD